jgi:hypothetical protein
MTLAPRPFLVYYASPSSDQVSGNYQQRHLIMKREELGEK